MNENFINVEIEVTAAANGDLKASCKIQLQKSVMYPDASEITQLKSVLSHFTSLFSNGVVSINSADPQRSMQQAAARNLLTSDKNETPAK